MKVQRYFYLIIMAVAISCSSNDNDEPIVEEEANELVFTINGDTIESPGFYSQSARRNGHRIHLGTDKNDTRFLISYDENGRFGKVVYSMTDPINSQLKQFSSFANFSSNYFDFELISLDTIKKRTKVRFSGYIYRNPQDRTSESKFVSGSFNLPYFDYVSPISNVHHEATINGSYWRYTNDFQKRLSNDFNNITIHSMSDDPYKIMITFSDNYNSNNNTGTLAGNYTFIPASTVNKVQIAKFDVATSSYVLYNCTGTMNVTNGNYLFIQGTYNFTGVNPSDPNDVITVQNGKFKLQYNHAI